MKTHIIIPIADIEDEIKNYNQLIEFGYDKQDASRSKHELNRILSMGKQISLDEKDIKEKAAIAMTGRYDLKDTNNQIGAGGFISGYKQALNELL
jgi:hypothetical protein